MGPKEVSMFLFNLGDNYIKNFHLGKYNVGYTVRNLVLRQGEQSLKT